MSTYTTYLGRIGSIMDEILWLVNSLPSQSRTAFTEVQMMIAINRVLKDLSVAGRWKTSGTLDLVAGQTEYDLLTLFPHHASIFDVRYTSTGLPVDKKSSWEELIYDREAFGGQGNPYSSDYVGAVLVSGDKLHLLFSPSVNATAALTVYYKEMPAKLGGGVEIDLDNVAVVNVGGGVVGFATTGTPDQKITSAQDLASTDSIVISGTTNYNGTYTPLAATTSAQIKITKTYVSETLGAGAKCGRYYTPPIPEAHDSVFVYGALKYLTLADAGKRKEQYQVWNSEYENAKNTCMSDQQATASYYTTGY